jgi:SH3 domain-containing protein
MTRGAALALILPAALMAAGGRAATAYVTDELVLNVFSELNQQGQRLATLHSGAALETLSTSGEFTQVRLPDGVTGWVKSTYLTSQVPATARVRQLEEELDRNRSTTPGLAEAAARSEVERLQRELAAKESELEAATAARPVLRAADPSAPPSPQRSYGGVAAGAVLCAGAGFWAGYVTLARRVRRKFGGLRVY